MQPKTQRLATSPPKSSALPEPWIERLFALRGDVRRRFADAWKGCSIAHVKAVWAEDLGVQQDELGRWHRGDAGRQGMAADAPEFMKL